MISLKYYTVYLFFKKEEKKCISNLLWNMPNLQVNKFYVFFCIEKWVWTVVWTWFDFILNLTIQQIFLIPVLTVQNLKKIITWSLSDCSSPCFILKTKSLQISGQNKSEACKPEELVKITNGSLIMEIFALAGNSN